MPPRHVDEGVERPWLEVSTRRAPLGSGKQDRLTQHRWTEPGVVIGPSYWVVDECLICDGELDPKPETIQLVLVNRTERLPTGQRVRCRSCSSAFVATGPHWSRPVAPTLN